MKKVTFDQLPAAVRTRPAFMIHHLHCLSNQKVVNGQLRKFKFDFREFLIMVLLRHCPDGAPLHFISGFLCVKPSGLTLILDRLVQRGLVRRVTNPKNRREYLASLTDKGARIATELETVAEERRKYYASFMPDDTYAKLVESATAFIRVIEKHTNISVLFFMYLAVDRFV